MLRDLLAAGADPKAHNEREATALHWAIADAAKVKLLLSKGADIEAKTVEGLTALYTAAMRMDGAGVIRILLEAGADPNDFFEFDDKPPSQLVRYDKDWYFVAN